ncbi:MAG: leucine-rich repeat protein [Clostridia bacterium]|nr:leucine-rich repeat protein [Clostridia bacterium]
MKRKKSCCLVVLCVIALLFATVMFVGCKHTKTNTPNAPVVDPGQGSTESGTENTVVPTPTQYKLQVLSTNGGSTNLAEKTFDANGIVTVVAYPKEGFYFTGWYSDDYFLLGTDVSFTFSINSNTVLRAVFAEKTQQVSASMSDENELLHCSGDFSVVVYCPEKEADTYIREHLNIYDEYYLTEEGSVVAGYESYANKGLGQIDNINGNLYVVHPNSNYDPSGAYLAKADGNVSILKEFTKIHNSNLAMASDPFEDDATLDAEQGVGEMAFSIDNTPHTNIVLDEKVVIYSYKGNPNANGSNVDGWILERIGDGLTMRDYYNSFVEDEEIASQYNEVPGGFITGNIEYRRNGVKKTLKVGDIVGFGGGIVRASDRRISIDQISEQTVFGRVKDIRYLGDTINPDYLNKVSGVAEYPLIFVELEMADESDVFAELDVYQETEVEMEKYFSPDDPTLIENAKLALYENEEFHSFLASAQLAVDKYAKDNGYASVQSTKSFLDNLKITPKVEIKDYALILTIIGELNIDFGKKEGQFGKAGGKVEIKFELKEKIAIGLQFSWIKTAGIKKGFEIRYIQDEDTTFTFDIKVTYSATTQSSMFLINAATGCIHKEGCWHIKQMLESNKIYSDKTLTELERDGYYPCGTCMAKEKKKYLEDGKYTDLVATEELNQNFAAAMSYRDYGDTVGEIRNILGKATEGEGSTLSSDKELGRLTYNYILTFNLKFYIHMSFKFEATLHYEHHVVKHTVSGARISVTDGFHTIYERESETKSQSLTLTGKVEVKLGVGVELSVSTPLGSIGVGIYGELGVYAELSGILHVSIDGDNYAAAYFELGIYYDVGIRWRVLWLTGKNSLCNGKIPLLRMGNNKVIYGYQYDIEEVLVLGNENKRQFTLDGDLQLMGVKTMSLPSFSEGTETLDLWNSDIYDVTLMLSDLGSWFEIVEISVDGRSDRTQRVLQIKRGAPYGETFEDVLTIRIEAKNKKWAKFDDKAPSPSVQLPTIQVKVICALNCAEHALMYLAEEPASCTETGLQSAVRCMRCRKMFTDATPRVEIDSREVLPALGHAHYELAAQNATCISDGLSSGTQCSRCGEILVAQTVIPAKGHTPAAEWTVIEASSCTSQGREYICCTMCNRVLTTRSILPTGHTLDRTEPTCTDGVHCTVCKKTICEPNGHTEVETTLNEATCTGEGHTRKYCLICDYEEIVTIPPLGHMDYADSIKNGASWHYIKEETCMEEGEVEYTCIRCEAHLRATRPVVPHNYGDWFVVLAPTCTEDGLQRKVCIYGCGDVGGEMVLPATGHNWTGRVVEREPSCEQDGVIYKECVSCGVREYEDSPALGHLSGGATCTRPDTCSRCGVILSAALGHDWSVVVSYLEPTYTEEGLEIKQCSRCDSVYERKIPCRDQSDHEHVWATVTVLTEPTCLEEGTGQRVCTLCPRTESVVIDPLGHDWADTEIVESTCEESGYSFHTCRRCAVSERLATTAPKGHTSVTEGKAPTCTEDGYTKSVCSVCGQQLNFETKAAFGHHFVEDHIEMEPTCMQEGSRIEKCTVCNETAVRTIPMIGHEMAYVERVEPTCTSDGHMDYHVCTMGCGTAFYSREEGGVHIQGEPIIVDEGHTLTEMVTLYAYAHEGYEVVNEHCHFDANGDLVQGYLYAYCSKCDTYFKIQDGELEDATSWESAEEAIAATQHGGAYMHVMDGTGSCNHWAKMELSCPQCDPKRRDATEADYRSHRGTVGGSANYGMHLGYNGNCECGATLGLLFDETDEVCVVRGIGSATLTDGTLVIPSSYMGKPVVAIRDEAFANNNELRTLIIHVEPECCIAIGDKAFASCSQLDRVDILTLVEGEWVIAKDIATASAYNVLFSGFNNSPFKDCPVREAHIPASVMWSLQRSTMRTLKVVGDVPANTLAFSKLTSLIVRDGAIGSGAFQNNKSLGFGNLILEGVTSIGASAFKGCTGLSQVKLPDTLVSIGEAAFSGCSGVERIDWGDNENELIIGVEAFAGCKLSGELTLPANTKSIGERCFKDNQDLTTVTVPSGVDSIGIEAFAGCKGITTITLPFVGTERNTRSGKYSLFGAIFNMAAPDDENMSEYTNAYTYDSKIINDGSSEWRYWVPNATINVILNSVCELPVGAFIRCYRLQTVSLPTGITAIPYDAFWDCAELTEIRIPEGVETIGDQAFEIFTWSENTTPIYLSLPASLQTIGKKAFGNRYTIKSVTWADGIGANMIEIGEAAFCGCAGLEEMTIPFVGGKKFALANDKSHLFDYIFGEEGYFEQKFYNKDGASVTSQYNARDKFERVDSYYTGSDWGGDRYIPKSLTSVTIVAGVTYYGAFERCTMIKNLTLGEGFTSLGDSTFFGCSGLMSISIRNPNIAFGSNLTPFRDLQQKLTIDIYESGQKRYTIVKEGSDSPITWQNAKAAAEEKKGYLASITSSKENGSLLPLIQALEISLWIGATDEGTAGNWRWVNGEYFEYNNWDDGEPNNSGGIEHYAQIKWGSGKWNDNKNDAAIYGYLVEYPSTEGGFIRDFVGDDVILLAYRGTDTTELTIPDDITVIGEYAFAGHTELTAVTIPATVTEIGNGAFSGCSSLASMTLPFAGKSMTASEGYDQVFGYIFGYTVGEESTEAACIRADNVSYYTSRSEKIDGKTTTIYTPYVYGIPASLQSVVLSGDVDGAIGTDGTTKGSIFRCCAITSVEFGPNVKYIPDYAFYRCGGLTEVTIPVHVERIGQRAFYYCRNLSSVALNEGLIQIDYGAFSDTDALNTIIIPQSVTTIGSSVFADDIGSWNTHLTIYCMASENGADWNSQWNKDMAALSYKTIETCYYSEDEPTDLDPDKNYWHYVNGAIRMWPAVQE